MVSESKSTLFIKNGYCCGHGRIVQRLENWCLKNDIKYILTPVQGKSYAILGDKSVELNLTKTLDTVLEELALSSQSQ